MNVLLIFVCATALLATNVTATVTPELLDAFNLESDSKFLEFSNLTLFDNELLPSDSHPHSELNVVELVTYYEYKVERHKVVTDDGYILEVHRITGNKRNPSPKGKPAVFLQHGLLCSSMDWVIAGPEKGLAFILADAGYDVWMGNSRGTKYSRSHRNMTVDNGKFWDFSWHEMGVLDLPAIIDHILDTTGNKKLTYVGHSQGSTIFFVMLSERPEYNDKITIMFSLAPVSYCSHMTSPVFITLANLTPYLNAIMRLIGRYNFDPSSEFFKRFTGSFCKGENISHLVCTNVLFLICGYDDEQMDKSLLPAILAHVPAGASTKQFVHYAQLYKSGHFRKFDFGWLGNLANYKSITPPSYNFNNIKAPVALHYSNNDWLSNPKDVAKLYTKLPNPVGKFRVPSDQFNHLDFLWAKDVKPLLYDKILNLMKRYKD